MALKYLLKHELSHCIWWGSYWKRFSLFLARTLQICSHQHVQGSDHLCDVTTPNHFQDYTHDLVAPAVVECVHTALWPCDRHLFPDNQDLFVKQTLENLMRGIRTFLQQWACKYSIFNPVSENYKLWSRNTGHQTKGNATLVWEILLLVYWNFVNIVYIKHMIFALRFVF